MERTDERMFELSRDLVEGMGYVLVSVEEVVEHGRRVLRFYIDRENGVGLDDCVHVSRELSYLLDAEPELESGYVLEVSSPGLDHKLKKEREYGHFAGREARLVLKEALDGRNIVTGVIAGAEGGVVRITLPEGTEVSIPLANVSRARLVV